MVGREPARPRVPRQEARAEAVDQHDRRRVARPVVADVGRRAGDDDHVGGRTQVARLERRAIEIGRPQQRAGDEQEDEQHEEDRDHVGGSASRGER